MVDPHSPSGDDGTTRSSWQLPRTLTVEMSLDAKSHPLATLSETAKTLQNTAQGALVLARDNPSVQRLVNGYELWENNLRSEAKKRLGGFQPPPPLLGAASPGLLAQDWDMLKRVNNTKALTSGAMKRSASENSLDSLATSSSSRRFGKQHTFDHQDVSFSYSFQGEAQAFSASRFGPPPGAVSLEHAATSSSSAVRPHLGMPRVPTAPSLQELSETLNTEAVRNIEAFIQTSRLALQNAQQSIQQTATNCQQNLQALTNILQNNVANNPNLQSARAAVTWSLANSSDPFAGALVPWSVFPRYLRARELEASGALLTDGSSSDDKGMMRDGSNNNNHDWVTPLENYMHQLDSKQSRDRMKKKSIRDPGRQVAIVTTASLPWLTGTAVNPLLRAAYLASDSTRKVTLVLPWLSKPDQDRVFPGDMRFETPEDQEAYVRDWARRRTGLDCDFKVTFYPGRYAAEKGSILPVGDITSCIPDHEADVAVLEEPEHLNWYHHGKRWTDKFNHVVGIMHTNYLDYARREEGGHVKEMVLKHINAWVCRIHCHKVIKLSDAVQPLPRQETMFVHGVSPSFLQVGQQKAEAALEGVQDPWGKGVYFLGKVLWAKGYTELLDRMKEHVERTGSNIHVDVYGSGPDLKAVEEEARKRHLNLSFNGARDHADTSIQDYKVFINPSLSDVVATTTAEALAMGKWVVCADHPSNHFFKRFPNCLIYRDSEEFSRCLDKALGSPPKPLSSKELHSLTWEAATERFLETADITKKAQPLEMLFDNVLHAAHNAMTGVEFLRVASGAGSNTRDAPARITDYVPSDSDVGGFFDNHARARMAQKAK
mmetsp:Transcript_8747/g.18658  ORF Transcript_8747/g.18658 Transcript_8747/m.18658 type:complete len:829 (+) Transcript_8747:101-2587(+)|eukprot:CAMPEP_0202894258 /NCGR_PEP_ID=MMETSP1392-20130828/3697_1 /ASSEMBLY_ACC=CAM_ASM_000868 /TAXON_ID=225041 /ORGANISM="Chlamydomonas chlamydogama, Strain SAG 11-48b" /LENGTH=828 /DNA_ID=CAMNT_0049578899 /DNA_START=90 /DNA_END=2576 /DNA_ORIENTATION=+